MSPLKLFERFPLATRFAILGLLLLAGGYSVGTRMLDKVAPPPLIQLFPDGAASPVFLARDAGGTAHIQSRSDDDAFFAIGCAHAQDRPWQLELLRRTIHGETSDLLGKEYISQDIWFRSLHLDAAARDAWPALSRKAQRSLEHYVGGINACMATQTELPLEFRFSGTRPQRWTVFDSLARFKLFALDFGSGFHLDLTREAARRALTTAQLHTLFPHSGLQGIADRRAEGLAQNVLTAAVSRVPGLDTRLWHAPQANGSIAWAVAGRYTETGAALMANAPHVDLQLASPWYELEAKGNSLAVSGMSLVGMPLVLFGHNRRIAWGGASLEADTQDIYYENVDPDNATRYEANGHWNKFETRDESIRIRADAVGAWFGAKPRVIRVQLRATRNGPLLSDQLDGFDRPFAMQWTGFAPGDTSYEAFYRLQFAADWRTFRAALAMHVTPALRMVYADLEGNIGSLAAGKVPVRKKGTGALPLPGWDDRLGWAGYMPVERFPELYNPPAGYVVAAAGQVLTRDNSSAPGQDGTSPARAKRITQLLEMPIRAGRRLSLADMRLVQDDVVDLDAAALAAELRKMRPSGHAQAQAIRMLDGWNGAMAADSQAAAIFSMWTRHVSRYFLNNELQAYWNNIRPGGYLRDLDRQMDARALRQALEHCGSIWSAASGKGTIPDCNTMLQLTLQAALDETGRIVGSRNMLEWRWDTIQQGMDVHRLLSQLRFFNDIVASVPYEGGPNSINGGQAVFVNKEGYARRTGAGFRQVISLMPGGAVQELMHSTDQSGIAANATRTTATAAYLRPSTISAPPHPATGDGGVPQSGVSP